MARPRDLPPAAALTANPFAALTRLRDELPVADAPAAIDEAPPAPAPPPARAVVRYQRKGRGGKEATIVEQLGLSPEQAELKRADSQDIDTRTDVYSLGVMLYELLT